MKFFCIAVLLALPAAIHAQMTPQYSSYVSRTTDANNNVHQTVVVDGQTTGSCSYTYPCNCNQYSCQQCTGTYANCVGAVHTPSIYNVFDGVGGWSTGPAQNPFTYMSYQTTVTVNVPPGGDQGAQWEGVVTCSAIGTVLDNGGLSYTQVQHNYPNRPLPGACWISQFYDSVNHGKPHHAEDVDQDNGNGQHTALPNGTPVYASEGGTVDTVISGNGPAAGGYPSCLSAASPANYVKIKGDDGYYTSYVHVTPTVSKGQRVTAGQQIGTSDTSGCQSAGHIHVSRHDPNGKPVNFTVPCTNPTPTTKFWDNLADDNDPDTL